MKRLLTIILVTSVLFGLGFTYLWFQDKKDADTLHDETTLNTSWIRENQEKIAKENPKKNMIVSLLSGMSINTGAATGYYYGVTGTTCAFTLNLPYEFEGKLIHASGEILSGKEYASLYTMKFYLPTTFTQVASYTTNNVAYYDTFAIGAYEKSVWQERMNMICDPAIVGTGAKPPICPVDPAVVKETENCVYTMTAGQEFPSDVQKTIKPLLQEIDNKAVKGLVTID